MKNMMYVTTEQRFEVNTHLKFILILSHNRSEYAVVYCVDKRYHLVEFSGPARIYRSEVRFTLLEVKSAYSHLPLRYCSGTHITVVSYNLTY